MTGPEQLVDDGPRLGRRRTWVVLAVVLVVLVGLGVLRFGGSQPDTAPAPAPAPTLPGESSTDPRAWPDDLPPGTLLVGGGGQVVGLDASTGALAIAPVGLEPAGTVLTVLADGVLVWRPGGRGTRLLAVDGLAPRTVRGGLRSATSFLPGPDGRVWATDTSRERATTWRLIDWRGRTARTVDVPRPVVGDGAGGFLEVGRREVRPVFPLVERRAEPGDLVATGPDGHVVRSCAEGECRFTLVRRDGTTEDLDTAVGDDTSAGTLSPGNGLLAVTEKVGGRSTIRVSVVATGEVKEIFPSTRQTADDAVWLDDRWLALLSEERLVLYDTTEERVVTPRVSIDGPGPLAWRPA
ncbi:hypothetical protein [Microlunatus spumicola]|uniref:hypothetical protein n=1 Tax=Microlunatus spumicola TaxID=81499 RepID=UPI00195E5B57